MEILVKVKDSKAPHLLEVLNGLSFVTSTTVSPEAVKKIRVTKKAKPMSKEKAEIIRNIKESVKEFNLVMAGKAKARDARELLNEL